jgi:hypothetical protein
MIDIRVKYQASIFTSSIEASAINISSMMSLFFDKGFIPVTYQELPIINQTQQVSSPPLRFSLKTADNEWLVGFRTGRIDVEKNMTGAKGKNLGEIDQFGLDAKAIFIKILTKYPQRANRIALASNLILNEMPPDVLDNVYLKLIHPTKTYVENPPVEWNIRSVSRLNKIINSNAELFNFCSEISRFSGQMNIDQSIAPLDRIAITLDINSIIADGRERFDEAGISCFCNEAPTWYDGLLNEVIEKIK